MKHLFSSVAVALILMSGLLRGEDSVYSLPVGYVTHELKQGFNFVGITLVSPAQATGKLTQVNVSNVRDSTANFGTSLTTGSLYLLEITSGEQEGLIVEVSAWSGDTLNLVDDLVDAGVAVGSGYTLTKVPTLEDIFGTTSSILRKNAKVNSADVVWLPNGEGDFDRYYQNPAGQWRSAASGAAAPNVPVVFLDGILIEKKSVGTVKLVVSGQVRVKDTVQYLSQGMNLVGTVFAAGSTLQNSGLAAELKRSNDPKLADVVWVPTGAKIVDRSSLFSAGSAGRRKSRFGQSGGSGAYARYYVNASGVWMNVAGGVVPDNLPLSSAVFIQKKDAGSAEVTMQRPSFYSAFDN